MQSKQLYMHHSSPKCAVGAEWFSHPPRRSQSLLRSGNLRAYCPLLLDTDGLGHLNFRKEILVMVQRVSAQEGRHVTQP